MCSTCPWRRGASAASMPGGFDLAWARSLRAAVQESGRLDVPILTCHHREQSIEAVCVGFLHEQARTGVPNLMVRIAIMRGAVRLPADDPESLTFDEMMEQMEADPASENRA